MAKRRIDLLFKYFPTNYPHHLEQEFPRILHKLMLLWAKPQFDAYIHELLVSSRPGRQGFPPAVMSELVFISKLHESCLQQNIALPPLVDPWENRTPQSYLYALQRGDLEQVRFHLSAGIPVDYHFEDGGGTPLVVAASAGQTFVASLLIQSGAFIDASDNGDYTALHWAAFYGHTNVAGLLLKKGANIDAKQNTGSTPLLLAVVRNQSDMVALLLRHGANAQIAGTEGKPLEVALKKGATDIATILRTAAMHKRTPAG